MGVVTERAGEPKNSCERADAGCVVMSTLSVGGGTLVCGRPPAGARTTPRNPEPTRCPEERPLGATTAARVGEPRRSPVRATLGKTTTDAKICEAPAMEVEREPAAGSVTASTGMPDGDEARAGAICTKARLVRAPACVDGLLPAGRGVAFVFSAPAEEELRDPAGARAMPVKVEAPERSALRAGAGLTNTMDVATTVPKRSPVRAAEGEQTIPLNVEAPKRSPLLDDVGFVNTAPMTVVAPPRSPVRDPEGEQTIPLNVEAPALSEVLAPEGKSDGIETSAPLRRIGRTPLGCIDAFMFSAPARSLERQAAGVSAMPMNVEAPALSPVREEQGNDTTVGIRT